MSLMQQLKSFTQKQHEQLDHSPLFSHWMNGTLSLQEYQAYLSLFLDIVQTFEKEWELHKASVGENITVSQKSDLLKNDLDFLSSIESTSSQRNHSEVPAKIKEASQNNPMALLGFLYVLEGSSLGGAILSKKVQTQYQWPENKGTEFLSCYGNKKKSHWVEFSESINNISFSEEDRKLALQSAANLFEWLAPEIHQILPA